MSAKQGSLLDLIDKLSKYRWPKKGDRLMHESQDWNQGVDFSGDAISRHVFIWDGYMKAGELLIEACEEHSHKRHSLIYPILFNYRHGIEVAIKWVIVQYGKYSDVKTGNIEHHNLWELWQTCKQIIIEVGSEGEEISHVEQVIKDFHDLDISAMAFRYPNNKNGDLFTLPDGIVELQNIREVMEGIAHFFDGVDGQLDSHISASNWPY